MQFFFFKLINQKPCLNLDPEQMRCIWSVGLELQINMFGNQIFEKQFFFSVFFFLSFFFPIKYRCQDRSRDLDSPEAVATVHTLPASAETGHPRQGVCRGFDLHACCHHSSGLPGGWC